MRKVFLSIVGFSLLCRLNVAAQTKQDSLPHNSGVSLFRPVGDPEPAEYNPRALHVDEINLVSSYYWQNGDHSAVTGGVGTEKVTDISNGIDLKLVWGDPKAKQNSLTLGLGIDHHTSASAAYVNVSGASNPGGSRIYPSIDWTTENIKKGSSFGIGAYYSGEYNYQSLGADMHFSQKTADKNGEFSAKVQAYFDQVKMIYPSEFIPTTTTTIVTSASGTSSEEGGRANIPSRPRNTYSVSLGYSQIINSRMQVMFLVDGVAQNGYLGLPFHRVYFNTGKDTIEHLPSNRFKLPLGVRLNYFLGDNVILRSYYRYYMDSWGVKSNTVGLETAIKVTPFFSVSPFYRYYDQTAAKYFAPYEAHSPTDVYYTSNYEYAQFHANFYGIGFRVAPPKGVLGWQSLHDLELRYGHYSQTTNLVSNVVSLSLGFK
ncbi:DUF3570 domain-containing protein [Mucilaginibacter sp. BT774]|uniref:DUF3570 domain-containing protein n=1 Tax=Mucilaginibacter sp. BT774 TaxID=3062276 RepID=UPI0026757EAC|nr:DUF3570 domain-containing protein [Mucilaginibacter sp. BT774]MDO3627324.1 DUF3570 domain-containing protein [Mucilaginibacter sp. BT774]